MFLNISSVSSSLNTEPRNTIFCGLLALCDHREGVGEETGERCRGRLLAHKSPDSIWLKKRRAGEQGGRNESEIPQTQEGCFSFKRLRIVGFHAYSGGIRKDFNLFASFSLGLNKIEGEHKTSTLTFFFPLRWRDNSGERFYSITIMEKTS